MKKTLTEFVKYCIVGGIGALITSYGNLIFQGLGFPEYIDPLHQFPIPWALGFAICCAVVSNFVLNKIWTFGRSGFLGFKLKTTFPIVWLGTLILDGTAVMLVIVSVTGLLILGPNTRVDLYVFAPYAQTAVVWGTAFVLTRWFYPVKIFYFALIWAFQELTWNIAWVIGRYPASLNYVALVTGPQWDKYVLALSIGGVASLLVLRHRISFRWKWMIGFLGFEAVYIVAGVPVVLDILAGTRTPGNWIWELGYQLVALPFYLLMFKEKREDTSEAGASQSIWDDLLRHHRGDPPGVPHDLHRGECLRAPDGELQDDPGHESLR